MRLVAQAAGIHRHGNVELVRMRDLFALKPRPQSIAALGIGLKQIARVIAARKPRRATAGRADARDPHHRLNHEQRNEERRG